MPACNGRCLAARHAEIVAPPPLARIKRMPRARAQAPAHTTPRPRGCNSSEYRINIQLEKRSVSGFWTVVKQKRKSVVTRQTTAPLLSRLPPRSRALVGKTAACPSGRRRRRAQRHRGRLWSGHARVERRQVHDPGIFTLSFHSLPPSSRPSLPSLFRPSSSPLSLSSSAHPPPLSSL